MSTSHSLILRSGLPTCSRELVRAAKARGLPVLVSANIFAVRHPTEHPRERRFRRFRYPDPELFNGLDVALDPSGFVAASVYGEYQWSVEDYLELVASHPWTWWAAMDYCCEPQVAPDRPVRLLRMAATVALYRQCVIRACCRGLSSPLPVIQGWTVDDYVRSVEWLDLEKWPALVGVGSVCRRHIHGPNGVLEIVQALDRVLPPHTRLHLFGVKSAALAYFAHDRRVASTDSMAWDFAARVQRRTSRTLPFRIACLDQWLDRQRTRMSDGSGSIQTQLPLVMNPPAITRYEELVMEAITLKHVELVLSNSMSYLDAVWSAKQDATVALAIIRGRSGGSPDAFDDLDEIILGLNERVEELRRRRGAMVLATTNPVPELNFSTFQH